MADQDLEFSRMLDDLDEPEANGFGTPVAEPSKEARDAFGLPSSTQRLIDDTISARRSDDERQAAIDKAREIQDRFKQRFVEERDKTLGPQAAAIPPEDDAWFGELFRGTGRGAFGVKDMAGATMRQTATSMRLHGDDAAAADRIEAEGQRYSDEAQRVQRQIPAARVDSLSKIRTSTISEFARDLNDYTQQGLGQVASTMAPIFMGYGVAGRAGAFGTSMVLGTGEVRQTLEEEGVTDPKLQEQYGWIGGMTVGALDALVPNKLLTQEMRRGLGKYAITRIVRTANQIGIKEAITETMQEMVQITAAASAAGHQAGEDRSSEEIYNMGKALFEKRWQLADAAALGYMGGKTMGAPGAVKAEIDGRRQDRLAGISGSAQPMAESGATIPDQAPPVSSPIPEDTRTLAASQEGETPRLKKGEGSVRGPASTEPAIQDAERLLAEIGGGTIAQPKAEPESDGGGSAPPAAPPVAATAPDAEPRVPTFNDLMDVLPRDKAGDADVVGFVERLGGRKFAELTDAEKIDLYREYEAGAPEASRAPVTEAPAAVSPPAATAPAETVAAAPRTLTEAIQQAAPQIEQAVQEIAETSTQGTQFAPVANPIDDAARSRFSEVLSSKERRSNWGKAAGISPEQLSSLIQEAVSDGRLTMRKGEPVRTPKARQAAPSPQTELSRAATSVPIGRAAEVRLERITSDVAYKHAAAILGAGRNKDAALKALGADKRATRAVLDEIHQAVTGKPSKSLRTKGAVIDALAKIDEAAEPAGEAVQPGTQVDPAPGEAGSDARPSPRPLGDSYAIRSIQSIRDPVAQQYARALVDAGTNVEPVIQQMAADRRLTLVEQDEIARAYVGDEFDADPFDAIRQAASERSRDLVLSTISHISHEISPSNLRLRDSLDKAVITQRLNDMAERLPKGAGFAVARALRIEYGDRSVAAEGLVWTPREVRDEFGINVDQSLKRVMVTSLEYGPDGAMANFTHEEIHVLRQMGVLRGKDWEVLAGLSKRRPKKAEAAAILDDMLAGNKIDRPTFDEMMAQAGKLTYRQLYQIDERYGFHIGGKEELLVEETVAHAAADWSRGREFASPIERVFQRIRDLLEAIQNAMHGLGFRSANDVFESIWSGELTRKFEEAQERRFDAESRAIDWMQEEGITAMAIGPQPPVPGVDVFDWGTGQTSGSRETTVGDTTITYGVNPKTRYAQAMFAFAGEKAQTADLDALDAAKQMDSAGESREDIWKQTGWFKGADRRWRFEIDDSKSKLRVFGPDFSVLQAELTHDPLFDAYPELADVEFNRVPGKGGEFVPGGIFPSVISVGKGETKRKSITLHESQHALQDIEGFAEGSNPDAISSGDIAREMALSGESDARKAAFAAYHKHAGEVESRLVQKRMDMSEQERRERPPWMDYDVPEADQIVRMPTGTGTPRSMSSVDETTGQSMRRDLDALGYYSQALEAAKGWQKKGTPEQALAHLKKSGVKDAEIEATGLKAFLGGKGSVTREELTAHLERSRVGLTESEYLSGRQLPPQPPPFAKWQSYSLDPDNPTYRETVLHLPQGTGNRSTALERITRLDADAASARARGDEAEARRLEAESDRIDLYQAHAFGQPNPRALIADGDFISGHFPEPNIIGHMMHSMTLHQGKPVYTIDQIQSDWGQKIRDGGARDEAKVASLRERVNALEREKSIYALAAERESIAKRVASEFDDASRDKNWLGRPITKRFPRNLKALEILSAAYGHNGNGPEIARRLYGNSALEAFPKLNAAVSEFSAIDKDIRERDLARAELQTADGSATANPLVNTTDQWVNTTLRRAIRQAAEADAEYIAIPSGKTVLSYNPGDEHGMEGFYDKIVPKNLRNLLQKIDKASPDPRRIETLDSPSGKTGLGKGFTLFPLTDKVKQSVISEGQPMFAFAGRAPLDMSPEARKERAEAMGFDTSRVWYHGTDRSFDAFRASQGGELGFGVYVTMQADQAAEYARKSYGGPFPTGANVVPIYVRGGMKELARDEWVDRRLRNMKELESANGGEWKSSFKREAEQRIADEISAEGYGGFYTSNPSGEASLMYDQGVIFDPSNIRSVNAAFDPAEDGSPQLMAAFGPTPPQPTPQDESPGLNKVISDLKKTLGMTVSQGLWGMTVTQGGRSARVRPPSNVRGQFDRETGNVSVRQSRDIKTLAHEGGHYLESILGADLGAVKQRFAEALAGDPAPMPAALSEGFANWFRDYILDPNAAESRAPGMTEAFEELLEAERPDMLEGFDTIQKEYERYIKTAPIGEVAAGLSSQYDGTTWRELSKDASLDNISGKLSTGYQGVIDGLNVAAKGVSYLLKTADANGVRDADGRPISVKVGDNFYKRLRLFAGSFSRGRVWLEKGVSDLETGAIRGPGLKAALEKALGDGKFDMKRYKDFNQYLVSIRAIAEYDRLDQKASTVKQYDDTITKIADARRTLSERVQKDQATLDRREDALTRASALLRDRQRMLGAAETRLENIQERLDGVLADIAEAGEVQAIAQEIADPTVENAASENYGAMVVRRRRQVQNLERDQQQAIRAVEKLMDEVAQYDTEVVMLEAETSQRREGMGTARQQLARLDEMTARIRRDREAASNRGASRSPTADPRAVHERVIRELGTAEFQEAAKLVHDFTFSLLEARRQAGFITQEMFDELSKRRDWYVPFWRDMSDIEGAGAMFPGSGVKKWSMFKKFDGSDRSILMPMEILSEEAYSTAQQIAFNDMMKAMIGLAERVGPGGGKLAERLARSETMEANAETFDKIKKMATDLGVDPVDAHMIVQRMEMNFSDGDIRVIMSPENLGPTAKPQLPLWENGERVMIRLPDPAFGRDLFDAINGLGQEMSDILVKALALPAQALRIGVTTHPDFIFRNIWRDIWTAWKLTGAAPFVTQYRGFKLINEGGEVDGMSGEDFRRLYNEAGGIAGGINVNAQIADSRRDVKDLLDTNVSYKAVAAGTALGGFTGMAAGAPIGSMLGLIFGGPVGMGVGFKIGASIGGLVGGAGVGYAARHGEVFRAVESVETATRLGVAAHAYKRAKEHNPDLSDQEAILEAAFVSRDIIDWNRRGSKMLAATRLVTFLNAQIQGLDKQFRQMGAYGDRGSALRKQLAIVFKHQNNDALSRDEVRDLSDAYKSYMRWGAITLMLMGLAALYADDDDYQDIKDETKATHSWFKALGIWFRLPKPFELGVPGNIGEIVWDKVAGRDQRMAERIADSMYEVLAPPGMPQVMRLTGGVLFNRDRQGIFAGRSKEIVGENLASRPPHERYHAFTSELAIDLSHAMYRIGVPQSMIPAPVKTDFVLSAAGAYWGREVQNSYQTAKTIGGMSTRPDRRATDFPILRGFTGEAARMSRSVNEMMSMISREGGEFTMAATEYKQLLDDRGRPIEAEMWLKSLDKEQQVWALTQYYGSRSEKREHPLQRAEDAYSINREIMRDTVMDTLAPKRRQGRKQVRDFDDKIELTPAKKTEVIDILARLSQIEARNTMILLKRPGFEGIDIKDPQLILDELKSASPDVHDLLQERRDKKVSDWPDVVKEWPKFRERVLKESVGAF